MVNAYDFRQDKFGKLFCSNTKANSLSILVSTLCQDFLIDFLATAITP